MQNRSYRIVEVFEITGRGVVAMLDKKVDLLSGTAIHVKITNLDGEIFDAIAFPEWLLLREPRVVENSGLLLRSVSPNAVPAGSMLTFD